MDAAREKSLSDLLDSSAIFISASSRLRAALEQGDRTLDELVVNSRTPARTVLLLLRHLIRNGEVRSTDGALTLAKAASRGLGTGYCASSHTLPPCISWLREAYSQAAGVREMPSLLWGQRRLTPKSALDRAAYILAFAATIPGPARYVFLGDDDFVSPLVAAADANGNVLTVDIDQAIIEGVNRVAAALHAELTTLHQDVSAGGGAPSDCEATAVICDPFPSADGSFERMFWLRAADCLCPNGILITTVAPSHKPEGYSDGALSLLRQLGFQLIDLRANFGQYEVFDFEFAVAERNLMRDLGLQSGVSHTKGLLAARFLGRSPAAPVPQFDFSSWTEAAKSHYLTKQAGVAEQQRIIHERGTGRRLSGNDRQIVNDTRGSVTAVVDGASGYQEEPDWLNLAQRAVESWERCRLDA
jgi:hypothetical protein